MADPVKQARNAVGNLTIALGDVDPSSMSGEQCASLIRVLRSADEIVQKTRRRVLRAIHAGSA